ncbi:Na/Pi symporter [Stella sp.]|uniref:Na/Pi symporter n=1 Tax=Stella sp. TaxID=2912054 RepID=UPI0035B47D61
MLFEVIPAVLGGLGLAMFGMRQVQVALQQMAGRRLRDLLRRATGSPGRAVATGIALGAVTQSTNAAGYVVLGLVTTGFLPLARACLVAAWSGVGTAAIVLLATIRLELAVLWLVGITGFLQVSRFRDSPLWGPGIAAMFGVGTLFLGLQILRRSLAPMTEAAWFAEVIAFSHDAPGLLMLLGAALALVVQSSTTVAAAVVALAASGWFSFEALLAIVYGAALGSAASSLLTSGRMRGTGRRLLLFQALGKAAGILALLAVEAVEAVLGYPSTMRTLVALVAAGPGSQTGVAFAAVQVAGAILATAAAGPLARLAERLSPEDAAETLAQPRFLYPEALADPVTAIDLAAREQARLAAMLPPLLDPARADPAPGADAGGGDPAALARGARGLAPAIDRFLDDLLASRPHPAAVADAVRLRSRNEMLLSQVDTLLPLADLAARLGRDARLAPFVGGMVESLHMLLETLAEAMAAPDRDGLELLRAMTGDRGDVVEASRHAVVRDGQGLTPEAQEDLLRLTGMFERGVWLTGRLARLVQAP